MFGGGCVIIAFVGLIIEITLICPVPLSVHGQTQSDTGRHTSMAISESFSLPDDWSQARASSLLAMSCLTYNDFLSSAMFLQTPRPALSVIEWLLVWMKLKVFYH